MAKQFAYRDTSGFIYPAHPSLLLQPGLVPGNFDTESRKFTPTGNPQEQVGTIITDANTGKNSETVLSGLKEDKGADTAPLTNGVVFTQLSDPVEEEASLGDTSSDSEDTVVKNARRVRKVK